MTQASSSTATAIIGSNATTCPPLSSSSAVVIVVRHAERLDYVMRDQGNNWVFDAQTMQGGRPWDPPLSEHGVEQGAKLGLHLLSEVSRLGLPPIQAVYSSPFLRCRQTASAAVRAMNHSENNPREDSNTTLHTIPPVRIEPGLSESMNERWYRSWAILPSVPNSPGSDGTWNYRLPDDKEDAIILSTPSRLHPASMQPVQPLLDWNISTPRKHDNNNDKNPQQDDDNDDDEKECYDYDYKPVTHVDRACCLLPCLLETREELQTRMKEAVDQLTSRHLLQDNNNNSRAVADNNSCTIVLITHGGPATYVYEKMTGNEWQIHGASTYCCYSIYRKQQCQQNTSAADGSSDGWDALVVNESSFLPETLQKEVKL